MTHVAVVAWGFPPCRGSGVYRALGLVRSLVECGARVSVITARRETFLVLYGADTSLEEQVPDAVRLVRVPFAPDRLSPLLSDYPELRVNSPRLWRKKRKKEDRQIFPEDVYAPWLAPATSALAKLHRDDPVDLTIATSNPYVDFEIAHRLWRNAGVPYVLDDRDSFLLDVFSGDPGNLFEERLPLFAEYARTCQAHWSVNPPLRDRHLALAESLVVDPADESNSTIALRAELASRFHVVQNGWDPGPAPPSAIIRSRSDGDSAIRFGMLGTITQKTPIRAVLSAWDNLIRQAPFYAELHLLGPIGFTNVSARDQQLERALDAAPNLKLHGRIPRDKVWDEYARLDVLVLAVAGGEMVTSGKVFEYMATGLPIVIFAPPDNDAHRVLSGYPRLHVADLTDTDRSVAAMLAAAEDSASNSGRLAAAQEFGSQHRRDLVFHPVVTRLLEESRC